MLALVHHRSNGSSANLGSSPRCDELITYKRIAGTRPFRLGAISFHSPTLSPLETYKLSRVLLFLGAAARVKVGCEDILPTEVAIVACLLPRDPPFFPS